jgi:hypothetical protein
MASKHTVNHRSRNERNKPIEKHFHLLLIVVASTVFRLRHLRGCLQLLERRVSGSSKDVELGRFLDG